MYSDVFSASLCRAICISLIKKPQYLQISKHAKWPDILKSDLNIRVFHIKAFLAEFGRI